MEETPAPQEKPKNTTQTPKAAQVNTPSFAQQNNEAEAVKDTASKRSPSSHTSSKYKVIISILILLLALSSGLAGYFVYLNRQSSQRVLQLQRLITELQDKQTDSEKRATGSFPIETQEREFYSGIPDLYSEVYWNRIGSGRPVLIMDNNSTTKEYIEKSLKGKHWQSVNAGLSEEEMSSLITNFFKYYESKLVTNAWGSDKVEYENFQLIPFAADSGAGSVHGYINLQEGKLQQINLSFNKNGPYKESESGVVVLDCPCTLVLEVFVSEITPIQDILQE